MWRSKLHNFIFRNSKIPNLRISSITAGFRLACTNNFVRRYVHFCGVDELQSRRVLQFGSLGPQQTDATPKLVKLSPIWSRKVFSTLFVFQYKILLLRTCKVCKLHTKYFWQLRLLFTIICSRVNLLLLVNTIEIPWFTFFLLKNTAVIVVYFEKWLKMQLYFLTLCIHQNHRRWLWLDTQTT